jgi:hypothetical protein
MNDTIYHADDKHSSETIYGSQSGIYDEIIAELSEKKKMFDDLVYITVNQGQLEKYQRKAYLYKTIINLLVYLRRFHGV